MSIPKKSLISTLKTTKKANLATSTADAKVGKESVSSMKTSSLKSIKDVNLKGGQHEDPQGWPAMTLKGTSTSRERQARQQRAPDCWVIKKTRVASSF